ncbi:hypothetical protein FQR65_LT16587 [Abscondita terminalis]|nr:hypothetical protein FQR65_LT16587 [Abscondita terminalis]
MNKDTSSRPTRNRRPPRHLEDYATYLVQSRREGCGVRDIAKEPATGKKNTDAKSGNAINCTFTLNTTTITTTKDQIIWSLQLHYAAISILSPSGTYFKSYTNLASSPVWRRPTVPHNCAVVRCANNSKRDWKKKYYLIPSDKDNRGRILQGRIERRTAWIQSLHRDDLTDTKIKHMRICSDHFLSGKPAAFEDTTNPDYVPHVKMGYKRSANSEGSRINGCNKGH